ncbi:MAG: VCBS repeat-containing protein, partial [Bacteroidota bacterium]|nr:VCBS repeat-containing protein [Bacteroidota bacterium]
ALTSPGMVTGALWSDYNNDGWSDLILVGEWMPVRIFENQQGRLKQKTDLPELAKSNGWWCSIFPVDIDTDGDVDYMLGNIGSNMQFGASIEKPVELYAGDFNHDGVVDPLLNYYIDNTSYPFATRDELLDQMSTLRKKFVKYEDYAGATIHDIVPDDELQKASRLSAYNFTSCWLENKDGKQFNLHSLPDLAQLSPVNAFVFDDFTGDGKKEIIAAGNFYPFKPQLGRSDAGYGLVMRWENGLKTSNTMLSDVWLSGDIRDMGVLNFKSGMKRVLISRNNDKPALFSIASEAGAGTVVRK